MRQTRNAVIALAMAAWPEAASAQTPPAKTAQPASSRATAAEVVIVTARRRAAGGGLIKQQTEAKSLSTISSTYIQTQASVQNVYQYLALTPGALVSAADPFGLSEQYAINVRGMGQDEIGYTLEGMPLNDIGFYSGYASQFIDSENIDEATLSQGSADIDAPVISAAGGLMSLTMLDPSLKPGGSIDFGYGSYDTSREFLRLDSGLLGDTGLRGFISYSHTDSDQWRGAGSVKRQHVDWKLVDEWGEGNRIAWSGEYHDSITPTYTLPTLQQFQQYGSNYNYDTTFRPGDYNYWNLYTGTFQLLYTAIPTRLILAENVTLNVTPYFQYGYGNSPYGTTLTEAGNYQGTQGPYTITIPNYQALGGNNGAAIMGNYTGLQYRSGVNAKITYTSGPNTVVFGAWTDYADEQDTQSYSVLGPTGDAANLWADNDKYLLHLPDGRILLADQDHVETQTNAVFLMDTLDLLDNRLRLEAGIKEAMVNREGTNGVPGPQYHVGINNAETLPRLSARYKLSEASSVFADVTTNFRTPSEASLFNQYYGGVLYTPAITNLQPEYSIAEEIGYRYNGARVTGSATFFNYNFTNRQIALVEGGSQINESLNAGGQTTRGVDAEIGTQPWRHISSYASFEYLAATIDSDIQSGAGFLPTRGKTAIRSPRVQAATGIFYDDGDFFGNVGVKFVDRQYATFMNDEAIPAYVTVDTSIGYRLPSVGLKSRPELKLNLINLNQGDYLSSVATPTTNAQTVITRNGVVVPGVAPAYYLSAGFSAIASLRQNF